MSFRYGQYLIVQKKDLLVQPHLLKGKFVRHGYNVCGESGWTNVMPGATWFQTVEAARFACDVLDAVGGDAKRFWRAWRNGLVVGENESTTGTLVVEDRVVASAVIKKLRRKRVLSVLSAPCTISAIGRIFKVFLTGNPTITVSSLIFHVRPAT